MKRGKRKKGLKCLCGKVAKEARLRFQGFEIDGWKCSCGEEFFDPQQAEQILLLNKTMKEKFDVTVGKIRSNLIVRIPTEVQKALGLKKGEHLKLKVESKKKIALVTV